MNYATNKYFLLLWDIDVAAAKKLWEKIKNDIPEQIYAGFANTVGKVRQQLINEVLNRLHEAINFSKVNESESAEKEITNFKMYRQEYNKKFDNTISPVLYMTQQKFNDKLFGMNIEQNVVDGHGYLKITGRNAGATLTITTAGFTKINIDIVYQSANAIPPKRISLDPKEFETGFLEDLLEHFIEEFRKEINDDNT